MTSFNNTKNKISKLWNKTQEQSIIINKQIETNRIIITNLNKLSQSQYASKAVIDFSSDWEDYVPIIMDEDGIIEGEKKWELYLPSIPENLISNIRIQIANKYTGNPSILPTFRENKIMQVEDIAGSDILKNLTVRAGIILIAGDEYITENWQFKLITYIINPNMYHKF